MKGPSGSDRFYPKNYTLDATIPLEDLVHYGQFIQSGSSKTLTIPTPIRTLVGREIELINTGSGNLTVSCTSGFVAAVNSYTVPTKTKLVLECVETVPGTYKWSPIVDPAGTTLSATTLGAQIAAATAKTAPIDADLIGIADTEAANVLKKTTVAEARAVLLAANPLGSVIAGLAAKVTPIDADSIVLCDSADTNDAKETTIAELKAVILSLNNVGAAIAGYTAKGTPVDADLFAIADTEDTNDAKKVTGTVLKSYLKTYNDTLYAPVQAPAAFTPTLDWTTATPEGMTIVARQETKGKEVTARLFITSTDPGGGGGNLNTITMPAGLIPADVNMKVPVMGFHRKDTGAADTWTDMQGWMDAVDGTEGNRIITMKNSVVWADNEVTELMLTWTYEIA